MNKLSSLTIIALIVALTSTTTAHAQWATLKGQFIFGKDGTAVPTPDAITPDKDVQVCGKNPLFQEKLTVNKENRGLANVVIWAFKPKKIHPDYAKTAKETVKMDNVSCRFEPHAVAVRTGQTLEIGNSDDVSHNSMITFLKNKSVNPMIPAKKSQTFQFAKSEIIPVKVACSIHPWMQGILLVQDHPYMAVTDKDGKFELKNLPAGKVSLKVWHEAIGYVQTVEIDNKKATWKRGRYSVAISDGKDQEHKYVLDAKLFEGK